MAEFKVAQIPSSRTVKLDFQHSKAVYSTKCQFVYLVTSFSFYDATSLLFAVIVNFPLDEDPSVSLIAWTTTPWTLPSNLALCVNPNITYVKIQGKQANTISYALLESVVRADIHLKALETECSGIEMTEGGYQTF